MKTSTLFFISVVVSLFLLGVFALFFGTPGEEAATPDTPGTTQSSTTQTEVPAAKPQWPLDYTHAEPVEIPDVPELKKCRVGILVDLETRKVLWAKETEKSVSIASLSKMMTALLVMDSVRNAPGWSLAKEIKVTKAASKIQGVWLDPRESFTVEKLLQATIIRSYNDCAYLLAEAVAGGKIEDFVAMMNNKATALGMKNTRFFNPHGLPGNTADLDNRASMEDLVRLAEAYMKYPELMACSAMLGTTLNSPLRQKEPTKLDYTNKLLRTLEGCNGLKTGYTLRAGCCVAASVERDGRRLLCIVTGFEKAAERDAAVKKLVDRFFK